jgi:hypothetical protein
MALFSFGSQSTCAQSSVLNSGAWYKMAVKQHGVYKITHSNLKSMGFDPAKLDPKKIKIYGNEGGMLPQPNNVARPVDLTELSIFVQGESDGIFHSQDYILFFAQGAHKHFFDTNSETFFYEKNLYANENYYFITIGETNGKRIASTATIPGTFPIVNEFDNFIYHELDVYSELKSGREWFGERFETTLTRTFELPLKNVIPNSQVKVISDVVAQSYLGSSFTLSLNSLILGDQFVSAIPNTQYGIKGRHKRDTFLVNATAASMIGKSSHNLTYQYNKASSGKSVGFLDYFIVHIKQKLHLTETQLNFRSQASLQNSISNFQIENSSAQHTVWSVTNPYSPTIIPSQFSNGITSFNSPSNALQEFVVFNNTLSPTLVGKVFNQNLRGSTTPALLIVTHPDFKEEAIRLANHRNSYSGLSTLVATTNEIYNEFSSGRQDVTAIRDFTKYLFDKNPTALKALLLFGKTSYDYKNLTINNRIFVPTYESRNSLHPLLTYSSDDYFAFLEESEGSWFEEPAETHSMDIGVGRLPVKTKAEAKTVVDKIITYDTDLKSTGPWRKTITFVADDGNVADGFTSIHQAQANTLAEFIESSSPSFDPKKIFIGTYAKTVGPSGETIPQANQDIVKAFNEGSLIINFTGHGSERVWCDERIFDEVAITKLENKLFPFLVTATCEFGRQDDPVLISSAELCVLQKNGGAIGLVTTARPVNSSTNFSLNEAFYQAFLQTNNNNYQTIGEIFRQTKNNSISGVSNRNFSLIGDPSLTLLLPERTVKINQVTTQDGSSTLKALSTVTVKGEIQNFTNSKDLSFEGILTATLFDKQTNFVTIGRNNPPYNFKQWYNALFRGQTLVKNGEFEFQFILPKNIAYQINEGKLSLYAHHSLLKIDATGASKNFNIGSSEDVFEIDNDSPLISLFIGDTTFANGGIANPNTKLIAKLSDKSGLNISGYGIGNSMIGLLDEEETFILNDYYLADVDNYQKGTITYPLNNLSPGQHSITVKVWDTHNNPAQQTINFMVTDGESLVIEEFLNYPNPFTVSSKLYFNHNRSGDDLEGTILIYNRTGEVIYESEWIVPNSPYKVDLLDISRSNGVFKNLSSGLYFARLIVRSLSNGSKNEQVTKLIIPN